MTTGEPISVADRARRIHAVGNFLAEVTEWGWDDASARRLVFSSDLPRRPRPLPRYLPVDADRRLTALSDSPNRLAADALLLQRACGLRIGELLDLELGAVHEVPDQGWWLKVPLGKLDTERMVPLDEETITLLDQIVATRSPGRPFPHPRTGRPAQFLVHPPRQTAQPKRDTRTVAARRRRGRPGPRHPTPATTHLRHRAANICEHCPSFRTDATYPATPSCARSSNEHCTHRGRLPVLAAQRQDAGTLAADAQARGWIDEVDRHRRLIARLDAVIAHAAGA